MLDNGTKRRIDNARQVLVGKVPDPKAQVEQITTALIYKFMDDMDQEAVELGGKASFFTGDYQKFAWNQIMDRGLGGHQRLDLYAEALIKMSQNPNLPQLFRDIFNDAFLPYRDPETLNLFLKEINGFTYDHSERLGDAFEYLLSVLGSQGAAGQFRTPRHIIDFIVAAVNPGKNDSILDPACGTAGFLISAYKHILAKNKDKPLSPDEMQRLTENFVGYDISPEMVRLSLVNMYLHQFQNPTIYEYDTLTSEERWDDTFDVILANPPFMSPKGGIRPHKRFAVQAKRSEVLFVDYIAGHLNPEGRAGVIVPEGIIFQSSNAYKALRKMLVEENYLYAVVSLPAGVFNPYSGVKTSILLLDRKIAKRMDQILFVNIQNDGFGLGAQRREINENDLPGAIEIISKFKTAPNSNSLDPRFVQIVLKKEIAKDGDYNLSGARHKGRKELNNLEWPLYPLNELTTLIEDGNWIERKDQSKEGIRLIQTGNVGMGEYLDKTDKARYITENTFNELVCTEVYEGDILISRLPEPVGRACIVPNMKTRMITAVDCTITRFNQEIILPKYFLYLSKTKEYYDGITPYLSGAIRKRISRKNLGRIRIPLPPLEVQREIVEEIEGYQKMIDGARMVVENYKPHISIKPDWSEILLGDIFKTSSGGTPLKSKKEYYDEGNIPWLRSGEVSQGKITSSELFITKKGLEESSAKIFPINTVLVAMYGATAGQVGILKFESATNQAICGIYPNDDIIPEFLYYILKTKTSYLVQISSGGAQPNISQRIIKNLKLPLPALDTQQAIVDEIKAEIQCVESNKKILGIFEKKIADKISEVWGESKEEQE